jgi:hypothetical protein
MCCPWNTHFHSNHFTLIRVGRVALQYEIRRYPQSLFLANKKRPQRASRPKVGWIINALNLLPVRLRYNAVRASAYRLPILLIVRIAASTSFERKQSLSAESALHDCR